MQNHLLSQYVSAAHTANMRQDFSAAIGWCNQALRIQPGLPEALYNLGLANAGMGRRAEALAVFEQARGRTQNSADAQNSIGLQLIYLGALEAAERCIKKALQLAPGYAYAHSNMGLLRRKQNRLSDAELCLRKAIRLQPNMAPAYINLAGVLNERADFEAAEEVCRQALSFDQGLFEAWTNLSVALSGLSRFAEAESASLKAIELDSSSSEAWGSLAVALFGMRRFEASERACRRAIELDPGVAEVWSNLGATLAGMKRHEEAAACFDKCLAINPDAPFAMGHAMHERMHMCVWDSFDEDLARLKSAVWAGKAASMPFGLLALTDDLAVQRKVAEVYAAALFPSRGDLGAVLAAEKSPKIRLAYFSADFHDHATSHLMAGLFEKHDKSAFELIAFSFGPDKHDEMCARVASAFDHFVDVSNRSDKEIAILSRELGVDIAVDLKGYTEDARPGIFAFRAAPVQVSYLGYPGTLGADYMDYLVADKVLISDADKAFYSEKIVQMPHSYQVNDDSRQISERVFGRDELGLPEHAFVFACFNSNYKITPHTFAGWMRILKAVDGSVLWLFESNAAAKANLRKEAEKRGISGERLCFAERLPLAEHLARIRLADLFLDTLPYNAHTTTSDALWAGLPVLTQKGSAFAGRVAASLLAAIGLPELVAEDQASFEMRAIELATTHRETLDSIRLKLAENRLAAPLFDTALFAQHIEAAYRAMYARYCAGLAPDHFQVDP
jgi:predicted O-linked N-acetylglucosamine transferase (SPINDLY family)